MRRETVGKRMTNRSKKDYAYTILDVTEAISTACEEKIKRSQDRRDRRRDPHPEYLSDRERKKPGFLIRVSFSVSVRPQTRRDPSPLCVKGAVGETDGDCFMIRPLYLPSRENPDVLRCSSNDPQRFSCGYDRCMAVLLHHNLSASLETRSLPQTGVFGWIERGMS